MDRVLLLLPDWVSTFESEFGLFQDMFKFCDLHVPHSFNILLSPIMSALPINWSKVPHTELVSDSEDDTKIAEAKVGEKQQREEEAKVEHCRQKEVSNKCNTCCGDADDGWHRRER